MTADKHTGFRAAVRDALWNGRFGIWLARLRARLAGHDPDEFGCYGPAVGFGDNDPVEREAPIWVFYNPAKRVRLP